MCGLFSILNTNNKNRPLALNDLDTPLKTLQHRGPDSYGRNLSRDHQAALGHARLSIIDIDGGAQPFTHEADDISLIVNGEFYDFERIRADLITKGHHFQSLSDSEIALHLYRAYGLDFVHHLRGEFALILYDGHNKTLIAVRDRFGIKPLVYAMDASDNRLYLASEAKAILAAGLHPQWDEQAYLSAAQMQYLPPNRTLFNNIHQLEPGKLLIKKDGAPIAIKTYWDMNYPKAKDIVPRDEKDAITELRDALINAVALRLRADVPVCCHLSGGIDSGAIAGIAASLTETPIDCFGVSFPDQLTYDEIEIAREQAAYIGAKLHTVNVTPLDMIDTIEDAVYKTEGLAINGHLAGKFLLSKAISENGFKVTLSGEGSDEIFAGYPHLREDILTASDDNSPLKSFIKTLYQSNDHLRGVFLADGDQLDTTAIQNALGYVPSFIKAKASLGYRICSLLKKDTLQENAYDTLARHFDVKEQLSDREIVDQSSYLWTKLTLAGYILKTLGDGCEMAHSLEGRVPFLDHKLFELVRSLPLDLKIRGNTQNGLTEKYILREAVKPFITETLYKRQKHPFLAPPTLAHKTMREKLGDMISSAQMDNQPFFDKAKCKKWFDGLASMDSSKLIPQEPVMMMILTTLAAQKTFNLGKA